MHFTVIVNQNLFKQYPLKTWPYPWKQTQWLPEHRSICHVWRHTVSHQPISRGTSHRWTWPASPDQYLPTVGVYWKQSLHYKFRLLKRITENMCFVKPAIYVEKMCHHLWLYWTFCVRIGIYLNEIHVFIFNRHFLVTLKIFSQNTSGTCYVTDKQISHRMTASHFRFICTGFIKTKERI